MNQVSHVVSSRTTITDKKKYNNSNQNLFTGSLQINFIQYKVHTRYFFFFNDKCDLPRASVLPSNDGYYVHSRMSMLTNTGTSSHKPLGPLSPNTRTVVRDQRAACRAMDTEWHINGSTIAALFGDREAPTVQQVFDREGQARAYPFSNYY